YAMAKADGKVQLEEVKDLHNLVRDVLIKIEKKTDEFGTNTAFYTEFEFETLVDNKADMAEAYKSFIKYISAHKAYITKEMIDLIIISVEKIAEAFEGIVVSEQILIDKLNEDFSKLQIQ
ncbi:hypothetical protein ACFLRI_04895, partial [Bacteroidota bacterium]